MHIRYVRTLLFTLVLWFISAASFAQISVGIGVTFAPPPLPVYEQPLCPGEGYIWTPGYWAYSDDFDDYYWVPGTWVQAPEVISGGLHFGCDFWFPTRSTWFFSLDLP
jgi:hypothetical protein